MDGGGSVARAGIALTGVGSTTIDARAAAEAVTGQQLTSEVIDRTAALAAEAARPSSDHRGSADYKRHVIHTFVTRILTRVSHRAEEAA
jgi:carbon-monoxide dehydrogenase medium subunit